MALPGETDSGSAKDVDSQHRIECIEPPRLVDEKLDCGCAIGCLDKSCIGQGSSQRKNQDHGQAQRRTHFVGAQQATCRKWLIRCDEFWMCHAFEKLKAKSSQEVGTAKRKLVAIRPKGLTGSLEIHLQIKRESTV